MHHASRTGDRAADCATSCGGRRADGRAGSTADSHAADSPDGYKDVEIRHLRAFVAVAEAGSLTAAARRLGTGQPALSRTLAQLERRLGARLVHRGARGTSLTSQGRRLLPHAQSVLAGLDEALAAVSQQEPAAVLGFGWLLPTWLPARLEHDLADSALVLRLRRTEQPLEDLRAGRVHAVIERRPVDDPALEGFVIGREQRLLVVAAGSRLTEAVGRPWKELAGYPVVVNRATGTTQPHLWDPPPSQVTTCTSYDEWIAYVASARGIGVVPDLAAELSPHPGVEYHPVPQAPLVEVLLVLRARDQRPAALALRRWVSSLPSRPGNG